MESTLELFQQRKAVNVQELSNFLSKQQNEVIECFGGITNIIELCLTHPQLFQYIDDTDLKTFERLTQILNNVNNDLDSIPQSSDDKTPVDECDIKITYDNNQNMDMDPDADSDVITKKPTTTISANVDVDVNDDINTDNTKTIDAIVNTNTNTNSNTSNTETFGYHKHSVETVTDYYHSIIIIKCHPENSLCYKFFDDEIRSLLMYKTILNKKTVYAMCGVSFVSFLIYWLYNQVTGTDLSRGWFIFPALVALIYDIFVLSTGNMIIIRLITHTFDFWFKVYNLVLLFVSMWIRASHDETARIAQFNKENIFAWIATIVSLLALFGIAVDLFLIDCLNLSIKTKRFVVSVGVICLCFNVTSVFFYSADYKWNPFNYEYTQLSFKSTLISSYINLIIFISKPIFSDLMRYLRKRLLKHSHNDHHSHNHKNNTINTGTVVSNGINASRSGNASVNVGMHEMINNKDSSESNSRERIDNDNVDDDGNVVNNIVYQRCCTVYKRPYLQWMPL